MSADKNSPLTLPESGARLDLHFEPSATLVTEVRKFVTGFYRRMLNDSESGSRIAMATHELLENTVKYSVDGVTDLSILVKPASPGMLLTIRTSNRATDEHRGNVCQFFAELRAAASSFAYFQELLHRNSERETGSGLGLARIAAEGDMMLDYTLEGELLAITAQAKLPRGGAS